MRALMGFVAVLAGLFGAAGPAGAADDLTAVTTGIASAAGTVTSFVVQTQINGASGMLGTMTFVRPKRIKFIYTMGGFALETYLVDGFVYMHTPAGGWQKTNVDGLRSPQQTMNLADAIKSSKVTLLRDRQEDGVTVGALQIAAALPPNAVPLAPGTTQPDFVCTYDKATFRLRVCANTLVTLTYSKYNDPSNVVELPAEAKNAVLVAPPALPAAPPTNAPPDAAQPAPAQPPGTAAPAQSVPTSAPAAPMPSASPSR